LVLGLAEDYTAADKSFQEALRLSEDFGRDYIGEKSSVLGFWGFIKSRNGLLREAERLLTEAWLIKEEIKDELGYPEILCWRGLVAELGGDLDGAADLYEECAHVERGRLYVEYWAQVGRARVGLARGKSDLSALVASVSLLEAQVNWQRADKAAAENCYRRALSSALCHSAFLLDEVLIGRANGSPHRPILRECADRGAAGKAMVVCLLRWWQGGEIQTGQGRDTVVVGKRVLSPEEAERLIRQRDAKLAQPHNRRASGANEPRPGPALTLVDRFDAFLSGQKWDNFA
jgi:tetratricopeptide (TPR) repeat protein